MGEGPDLEQIYRDHHAFVWRVVRRLGVSDDAVDDAVQETFVVLHRRRAELDWSRSVRGLLYGVARRIAKRARERGVNRPVLSLVPTQDPGPDPEQQAQSRQKAAVVREALDAMDTGKRLVFVLADVEGMTIPEVADCLQINLNTAYARQRAARKLVAAAIARHRAKEERSHVGTGRR